MEITINNGGTAQRAVTQQSNLIAPQSLTLSPGVAAGIAGTLEVEDEAQCLALAAQDGIVDRFIDSRFELAWPDGRAQCSARIECPTTQSHPSWRCGAKGKGAENSDGRCLEGGNGKGQGNGKGKGKGNGQGNGNGQGGGKNHGGQRP